MDLLREIHFQCTSNSKWSGSLDTIGTLPPVKNGAASMDEPFAQNAEKKVISYMVGT